MYCKYGILEQSFGLDTVGKVLGIGLSILSTAGGLKRMGSNSAEVIVLKNAVGELKGGLASKVGDFTNLMETFLI